MAQQAKQRPREKPAVSKYALKQHMQRTRQPSLAAQNNVSKHIVSEVDSHTPWQRAVVQFYNWRKGYGFLTPKDGGQNIHISQRVLDKSVDVERLEEGREVEVTWKMVKKGPTATAIRACK
jgi:cold shock CspA family protein